MSEKNSPNEPSRPPASGEVSPGDEAARAVRDVLDDQRDRRSRQEVASRREPRKRLLPLPVVGMLWGVACLVVWAATPEFLLPEPLPEPTPAELEAGLRMEMLVLVGEINRYREETGRVPDALERVLDDPPADVRYVPFPPSSYRLSGERGTARVAYQSGDPIEELRGNARELIQGSPGSDP